VDIEVKAFDVGKKVQGFTSLKPEEQMKAYTEIAVNLFDLLDEVKSEDTLEEIIQKYLLGNNPQASASNDPPQQNSANYFGSDDDEDDDIPDIPEVKQEAPASDPKVDAKSGTPSTGNEDLDELLSSM